MKKLSSLILATALCLSACSGNKQSQQTESNTAVKEAPTISVAQNQATSAPSTTTASNKLVKPISIEELQKRLDNPQEKLEIYNFWATWCKPCIKELPYFEQVAKAYKKKGVKVTLVSLDFLDVLDTNVIPFVKKKQLQTEVLLLDPGKLKMNDWIDMISPEWTGTIPATIMVGSKIDGRAVYEKEFTYEELEELVKKNK